MNSINEIEPLGKKFKHRFKEWCETSTSHGIPNIARGRNWFIKIMWTLFFLGSFGYCAYVIIKSILDYLKYETTVSITQYQELPAKFPAVTICNLNPFNEYFTNEFLAENEGAVDNTACFQNLTTGDNLQKCTGSNGTSSILDDYVNKIKRVVANANLTKEERMLIGNELTNMLYNCEFNNKRCNESNFTYFWSNEYGNCYTFNANSDDILKSSETGKKYGLKMELFVTSPNTTTFAYNSGLYLLVHNQSSLPFTLKTGISLPTGFETYIGVQRHFLEKLDAPYSDCLKELKSDKDYAKKLYDYSKEMNVYYYDQEFCFTLCFQDKLVDKCNCSDIITPTIRNVMYCASSTEMECMDGFKAEYSIADLNSLCDSACPQQCNNTEYKLYLSSATFPTLSYLNLVTSDEEVSNFLPQNDSLIETFAQKSFLKFIVDYESLYYTLIKESPSITVEILLGNIGGQLGLFIGISFLSFIELFELFSEFVIIWFEHRKEKREAKKKQALNIYYPYPMKPYLPRK